MDQAYYTIKKKNLLLATIAILVLSLAIGIGLYAHRKARRIRKAQQAMQGKAVLDIRRLLEKRGSTSFIPDKNGFIMELKPLPIGTPNSWTAWSHIPIPQTFILCIPHGQAISDKQYIIADNKYVIADFFWPWEIHGPTIHLPGLPCKFIPGRVVAINDTWENIYSHWLFDVLPKIKMLKDANIEYDWIYTTIPSPNSYQQRTLELLGVDISKVINSKDAPYIEAELLFAPSSPTIPCYHPKWIVDYLRTEMFSRLRPATIPLSKKIFISRNKARRRYFHNEDDLFSKLEVLGFKRYWMEDLTVDDQIHLFANADQIVSSHGSCLANLAFCKNTATVVEILQTVEDNSFCCLAQTVGLRYTCVQTVDLNVPQDSSRWDNTSLTPENIEAILWAVNNPPKLIDSPLGIPLSDTKK